MGTENEVGKGWGERWSEEGCWKLCSGGNGERDVAENKGKMREGIQGSDKTMDVGWNEGR